MDFKEYKEAKLKELIEYKKNLYENYKDQTKTINSNIFTLSSSAIFAMFVFLFDKKMTDTILTLTKISAAFLFITLLLLIVILICYASDSSNKERIYSDLYSDLLKEENKERFENRIKNNYNSMIESNFYERLYFFNIIAYITFFISFLIFAIIILFYFTGDVPK